MLPYQPAVPVSHSPPPLLPLLKGESAEEQEWRLHQERVGVQMDVEGQTTYDCMRLCAEAKAIMVKGAKAASEIEGEKVTLKAYYQRMQYHAGRAQNREMYSYVLVDRNSKLWAHGMEIQKWWADSPKSKTLNKCTPVDWMKAYKALFPAKSKPKGPVLTTKKPKGSSTTKEPSMEVLMQRIAKAKQSLEKILQLWSDSKDQDGEVFLNNVNTALADLDGMVYTPPPDPEKDMDL